MRQRTIIYFFVVFFFLFQTEKVLSQTNNAIIVSVGDYAITRLDLFKEIKIIAILSNTRIDETNRDQIRNLAIKSLIKRKIKQGELEKRNISRYNRKQLNFLIDNASNKIGLDRNGLKELFEKNNLIFENLVKKFEIDLQWNYMIFQIYKNRISLNTAEIENKINLYLENSQKENKEDIETIKEKIVDAEKEKKLKMFSNLHYSNLERSTQINFL